MANHTFNPQTADWPQVILEGKKVLETLIGKEAQTIFLAWDSVRDDPIGRFFSIITPLRRKASWSEDGPSMAREDDSLAKLEELSRTEPYFLFAQRELALYLMRRGETDRAKKTVESIRQANPWFPLNYSFTLPNEEAGELYYLAKEPEVAAKFFRQALPSTGDPARVLRSITQCYRETAQKLEDSVSHPEPLGLLDRARLLAANPHLRAIREEVLASLKEWNRKSPFNTEILDLIAQEYQSLLRHHEEYETLTRAAAFDPRVRERQGKALEADTQKARLIQSLTTKTSRTPEESAWLANLYELKPETLDRAAYFYKEAETGSKDPLPYLTSRIGCYERSGRPDKAAMKIKGLLEIIKGTDPAMERTMRIRLATNLQKSQRTEEAAQLFTQILGDPSLDIGELVTLTKPCLLIPPLFPTLERVSEAALQENPDIPEINFLRSRLITSLHGDTPQSRAIAIELLEKAVALDLANPSYHKELAHRYQEIGKPVEAAIHATEALVYEGKDEQALVHLSEIASGPHLHWLRQAYEVTGNPEILISLAKNYLSRDDTVHAHACLTEALQSNHLNPAQRRDVHKNLGITSIADRIYPHAVDNLLAALEASRELLPGAATEKEDLEIRILLSEAFPHIRAMPSVYSAERMAEEITNLNILACRESMRKRGAPLPPPSDDRIDPERLWRQALAIDPKNPRIKYNLAIHLVNPSHYNEAAYDEARKLLEDAVKEDPQLLPAYLQLFEIQRMRQEKRRPYSTPRPRLPEDILQSINREEGGPTHLGLGFQTDPIYAYMGPSKHHVFDLAKGDKVKVAIRKTKLTKALEQEHHILSKIRKFNKRWKEHQKPSPTDDDFIPTVPRVDHYRSGNLHILLLGKIEGIRMDKRLRDLEARGSLEATKERGFLISQTSRAIGRVMAVLPIVNPGYIEERHSDHDWKANLERYSAELQNRFFGTSGDPHPGSLARFGFDPGRLQTLASSIMEKSKPLLEVIAAAKSGLYKDCSWRNMYCPHFPPIGEDSSTAPIRLNIIDWETIRNSPIALEVATAFSTGPFQIRETPIELSYDLILPGKKTEHGHGKIPAGTTLREKDWIIYSVASEYLRSLHTIAAIDPKERGTIRKIAHHFDVERFRIECAAFGFYRSLTFASNLLSWYQTTDYAKDRLEYASDTRACLHNAAQDIEDFSRLSNTESAPLHLLKDLFRSLTDEVETLLQKKGVP